MLIISIIGLVIAIGLGLLISSWLTKKFKIIINFAQKLGEGDLIDNIEIKGSDEIDTMSSSLNKAINNIKELISEVLSGAENISAASEELSAITQEVSATSEESASNSEEILESINETTFALEKLSKSAKVQAELAEQLNKIVQRFKNCLRKIRALKNFKVFQYSYKKRVMKLKNSVS